VPGASKELSCAEFHVSRGWGPIGCSPGETRYAHNWQRGSDARPVAAHMQPEAVRGRYEDAKRRSEWVAAANAEALLTSPGLFLPKVSASPPVSRSTLQMGEAAIRNGSVIQSRAQAALNRTESFASRHGTTRSSRCLSLERRNVAARIRLGGATAGQRLECAP
jgi:hypothetical protein